MFSLLAAVLTFAFWIGSTALIIKFDARRQRAAAQAAGGADFMDRSLAPYLILAIFSGALPLIFYFGTTRKKVSGWLLGLGVCALDVLAVCVVGAILFVAGGALDKWSLHRENLEKYTRAHAACGSPLNGKARADDTCSASLTGVLFYTANGNDADEELELKAYGEACETGRIWACAYLGDDEYSYRYKSHAASDRAATVAKWTAKQHQLCDKNPLDPDCSFRKLP